MSDKPLLEDQCPICNHQVDREVCKEGIEEFRRMLVATHRINYLFDAIKHGIDEKRHAWLEAAIEAHFTGQPIPQEAKQ